MRIGKVALIVLLSIAFLGCRESSTYRGHYTYGFEVSSFTPCGTSARWWATGNTRSLHGVKPGRGRGPAETVYAEIRGIHRWPGLYGHLNRYFHKLTVKEVVVVRPKQPTDCS